MVSLQTFHDKGPHRLLLAGSRSARGQITVSGIRNGPTKCAIFRVHTKFTNVAAVRISQAGGPHAVRGPQFGDPCFKLLMGDKLDAQFFLYNTFVLILYMFRANTYSSSGVNLLLQHLV